MERINIHKNMAPGSSSTSPLKRVIIIFFISQLLVIFSANQVSSRSVVPYLPGYPGKLPFRLETGYVSVGDSELFYYFVESQNDPSTDPLFFWLTGGPGCSAFTGLAYGNGPIIFDTENYNGGLPTLMDYPFSWTQHANFIYIDAPVGTGFSYSTTPQGWRNSDTISARQAHHFVAKWIDEHPRFSHVDLLIGGDSYAGIIVPLLVKKIVDANEAKVKPHLNIKGYLVGSPVTDYTVTQNSQVEFAHKMTLISNELYEAARTSCNGNYASVDPSNAQCLSDLHAIDVCIKDLNDKHILDPKCIWKAPNSNHEYEGRSLEQHWIDQIVQQRKGSKLPPRSCGSEFNFALSNVWANDERVQDALHIRKGNIREWNRCNKTLKESYTRDVPSVIYAHQFLTTKDKFRVLVQSGDHDMDVTVDGTMTWIKSLNLTVTDDWRPWFVDDQVGGYTRKYSKGSEYYLAFATVKGAGHTAQEYKRKECYNLFYRWINNQSL